MGLFNRESNYTEQTIGIIVGISNVKVNTMHLPVAKYEVNGITYKIRVPHNIAVKMEKESGNKAVFIKANLKSLANINGQITKIQGCEVKIAYNPENPKKAKVVE